MSAYQVRLPLIERPGFGQRPVLGTHSLPDADLFSDAALIDLLDHFPREHLYAQNMGQDPLRFDENRLALHDDVSGAELLRAVKNGRLWLNITRIDRADVRYRQMIDALYQGLREQTPDLRASASPNSSQGTLLISSPQALVYYHADAPASVLWHIRGQKRVWVYPPLDTRYMRTELLEDIFAGVRHEYLPYERSYDEAAEVFDLEPGQWISWPQNAPHRVSNLDSLNVSLSTEHFSQESRRRFQLYLANRFFRTRLGVQHPSTEEAGFKSRSKVLVQRVARKLGLDPVRVLQYQPMLRVSADAPGGVMPLDAPIDQRLELA